MEAIIGYAIGISHQGGIWFYVGNKDDSGKNLKENGRFSSVVNDALVFKNNEDAEYVASSDIPAKYTKWVMAVYDCPTCKRRYVGHPALSRADNKTQICPDCGVIEALRAAIGSLG